MCLQTVGYVYEVPVSHCGFHPSGVDNGTACSGRYSSFASSTPGPCPLKYGVSNNGKLDRSPCLIVAHLSHLAELFSTHNPRSRHLWVEAYYETRPSWLQRLRLHQSAKHTALAYVQYKIQVGRVPMQKDLDSNQQEGGAAAPGIGASAQHDPTRPKRLVGLILIGGPSSLSLCTTSFDMMG